MYNLPTQKGNFGLVLVALLPAIVLCVFVVIRDKSKKKESWLLFRLIVFGAISCFLAILFEGYGQYILNKQYIEIDFSETENTGIIKQYLAKYCFGVIAIAEESVKFLVLWSLTREKKSVDSLYDGIYCAIFASLGFAAFENILYVQRLGMNTGLKRMYTAVPAHMFFGVLMGYYYSKWCVYKKARALEDDIIRQGVVGNPIRRISRVFPLVMTLVLPIAGHGAYNYFAFTMELRKYGEPLFYIYLAILYIVCFRIVFKISKKNEKYIYLADAMILKKYPNLVSSLRKDEEEISTERREELC